MILLPLSKHCIIITSGDRDDGYERILRAYFCIFYELISDWTIILCLSAESHSDLVAKVLVAFVVLRQHKLGWLGTAVLQWRREARCSCLSVVGRQLNSLSNPRRRHVCLESPSFHNQHWFLFFSFLFSLNNWRKTQTAVYGTQAPIAPRNLKLAIFHRTLKPQNVFCVLLCSCWMTRRASANVFGRTACLFSSGFIRQPCPNKSAACMIMLANISLPSYMMIRVKCWRDILLDLRRFLCLNARRSRGPAYSARPTGMWRLFKATQRWEKVTNLK